VAYAVCFFFWYLLLLSMAYWRIKIVIMARFLCSGFICVRTKSYCRLQRGMVISISSDLYVFVTVQGAEISRSKEPLCSVADSLVAK